MTREECISLLNSYAQYGDIGIPNLNRFREAMRTAAKLLQCSFLPSNLDEAAEKIAWDIAPMYPDISWDKCFEKIKEGIKAGAEWMAGQGVTVEGIFKAGDPGYPDVRIGEQYSIEHILHKPDGIEPGDKVVVQIRKK